VAFFSRKLTTGQANKWTIREKEMYALVLALKKYAGLIGGQPVLVVTDHKSIEQWMSETLATPTGPTGRQARWHQLLSLFDLRIEYIKGKDNEVPDCMSRFAYPAGLLDVSMHGCPQEDEDMKAIIAQELAEERTCNCIRLVPTWRGETVKVNRVGLSEGQRGYSDS
jgi:hypothetical protein